jgi:hypothetical protein
MFCGSCGQNLVPWVEIKTMLEGIVGDNAYVNINQWKLTNFVKP